MNISDKRYLCIYVYPTSPRSPTVVGPVSPLIPFKPSEWYNWILLPFCERLDTYHQIHVDLEDLHLPLIHQDLVNQVHQQILRFPCLLLLRGSQEDRCHLVIKKIKHLLVKILNQNILKIFSLMKIVKTHLFGRLNRVIL